ncbi:hypothetical protein [Streptomyces sp. NPDC001389]|uniref:hypothetical protein n=1 Tax=Streptomyces sp. NPDC001389 TaxID=3364569 RepID=UPI0036AA7427
MSATDLSARVRSLLTEFRLAVALMACGAPTALAGAAFLPLPGAGAPVVVVGLSCLVTGLVMLGEGARSSCP